MATTFISFIHCIHRCIAKNGSNGARNTSSLMIVEVRQVQWVNVKPDRGSKVLLFSL